ncbi:TasA family protein [Blastococcus capsensis]|uniref:TasA family protein n=1 Tax=Blastococcus capsensis TaxID=1564163 RepID=UPI00253F888E|nr:TasA family protein [Blastococcus capsensis]MDK3258206.1 TasA family protein [Blastococcus capsensis]
MSAKTAALATSPTARKIVGSLGVIGAAAAVAGMGTFGTFTDSTTPVTATIASGTVDIDLTGPAVDVAVDATGFVPGDSVTGIVVLANKGTAPLGSVTLSSSAAGDTILTTDVTNGLQMALKSCSVAWSADKTCAAGETVLSTGPVTGTRTLVDPASLAVGGTDHLAFTISLPTTADNAFQGRSTSLSLVFTGTQRTGTAS